MVNLILFVNTIFFFYLFLIFLGLVFIVTSLFMILTESSVHAILYLMFLFLYLTELTILLKMEFLALIFIIVYIGAVCVLMLFHIKLIKTFLHRYDNINNKELFLPFLVVSILIPFLQILTVSFSLKTDELQKNFYFYVHFFLKKVIYNIKTDNMSDYNYINWINFYETFKSTNILGFFLYNIYFIHLFISSLVLFIAMIGSIFITLESKKNKKMQKLEKQIFVSIWKSLNYK